MQTDVTQQLGMHIETSMAFADQLTHKIIEVGEMIIEHLFAEGKVLCATEGRAYANGLHFMHAMMKQEGIDRPPLPSLLLGVHPSFLSVSGVDEGQVYAREIQAFGTKNDILLLLSTSGIEKNLGSACIAAKEKNIRKILIGKIEDINSAHEFLDDRDMVLPLPAQNIHQVLVLQLLALQQIVHVIEQTIFKQILE